MPTIFNAVKRVLVGRPFRNDSLAHTLLPKRIALPIFASDALSSVAYAPDEILLTLALAGVSAVAFSPWVGLAVMVVLLTVVASYRQNVHAYPSGGGDYEIANENLGKYAGLTVASALLVDYVLTVAVSMSSAATYLTTAVPSLHGQQAGIATIGVVILALVNLRGIKEAGSVFAVPTYIFMASILGMTAVGVFQAATGQLGEAPSAAFTIVPAPGFDEGLVGLAGAFLLLRAFSSGAAALTGIEAISNGVPNFKKPKSKNAATTLLLLGVIASAMLAGIIYLANATKVHIVLDPATEFLLNGEPLPEGYIQSPAISQIAQTIFGAGVHPLLHRGRRHRRDPRVRVQHGLQRLPGAGLDPGPGRLPAPPAAHPRGPAGLQQRRPGAGRRRPGADHRVQRGRHQAHPALHRGRLHLLHDQPARHGPALGPGAETRQGPRREAADAQVPHHQQHRLRHDRHWSW